MQLSSGKTVGGMLFADDFVGVSDKKKAGRSLLMLYRATVINGDYELM